MSNYRLTITKCQRTMNSDLKGWAWRLERKDGTIGYTDSGETYTWLGAYLLVKYRLWKNSRPVKKKEFDL